MIWRDMIYPASIYMLLAIVFAVFHCLKDASDISMLLSNQQGDGDFFEGGVQAEESGDPEWPVEQAGEQQDVADDHDGDGKLDAPGMVAGECVKFDEADERG